MEGKSQTEKLQGETKIATTTSRSPSTDCLSVCRSACLSICLSAHLSVCLCLCLPLATGRNICSAVVAFAIFQLSHKMHKQKKRRREEIEAENRSTHFGFENPFHKYFETLKRPASHPPVCCQNKQLNLISFPTDAPKETLFPLRLRSICRSVEPSIRCRSPLIQLKHEYPFDAKKREYKKRKGARGAKKVPRDGMNYCTQGFGVFPFLDREKVLTPSQPKMMRDGPLPHNL